MRPISRKQHAILDYLSAATEFALPQLLPAKSGARRLLRLSAANAAALGAVTRHELGLVKLVPMRVHLALDGAMAALFLGASAFMADEEPAVRRALAGLGVAGALAAILTDPNG